MSEQTLEPQDLANQQAAEAFAAQAQEYKPKVSDDGIADFTPESKNVRFRIGEDIFEGLDEMPTMLALRFATRVKAMDVGDFNEDQVNMMTDLMRLVLKPASAAKLIKRLEDTENPIGPQTFIRLIPWLMEQYGMRPTSPSSDSPSGQENPDDGVSSTGSTSVTDATSSPSVSTDS
jgi:hypothetical protein